MRDPKFWAEAGLTGLDKRLLKKWNELCSLVQSYGRVVVAFSGGCDSALIAKVARDILGRENAKAVTARSESLPLSEIKEVEDFVRRYDIDHTWIRTREIENPQYASNPTNRCYFCKTELYHSLEDLAGACQIGTILNGTNVDDLGDWRPGLRAASEFEVKSPLVEAKLHKSEIRELSKHIGLATWDKPAAACLSSRFPYGRVITPEKLRQVDKGEEILKSYGFQILRLRHFGGKAKIELGAEELSRLQSSDTLQREITSKIRRLGFHSVEIDPEGYRQGKLNQPLDIRHQTSDLRPRIKQ